MTFSIIIPVYNVAPYLRECLRSVIDAARAFEKVGQESRSTAEFFNSGRAASMRPPRGDESGALGDRALPRGGEAAVEITCVDDGSTDGSGEILDEIEQDEGRRAKGEGWFRVVHQRNAGVSAARNAALDIATGDYICFVDGDDGVVEDYFIRLAEIIAQTGADMIRFGYHSVLRPDDQVGMAAHRRPCSHAVGDGTPTRPRVVEMTTEAAARDGFRAFVSNTWAWNMVARREVIQGVRFERIPNGEDILFAAQVFCRSSRIALTEEKLYKYVRREGSAARVKSLKHLKSVCTMVPLLVQSVNAWRWGAAVRDLLDRRVRNHLLNEVASPMRSLSREDRAAAWAALFGALEVVAWSGVVKHAARHRSRAIVTLLLGVQRGRAFAARMLRKSRSGKV